MPVCNKLYSNLARATPEEQEALLQRATTEQRLLPTSTDGGRREPYSRRALRAEDAASVRILNLIGSSITGGGGRHVVPRHLMREHVAPAIGAEIGGEVGEGGRWQRRPAHRHPGRWRNRRPTRQEGHASAQDVCRAGDAGAHRAVPSDTLAARRRRVTGGQATGSESAAIAWRPDRSLAKRRRISRQQARQFTRAGMRRAGIDSDRADAATLGLRQDRFSHEYERLDPARTRHLDGPTAPQELLDLGIRYEGLKGAGSGTRSAAFSTALSTPPARTAASSRPKCSSRSMARSRPP